MSSRVYGLEMQGRGIAREGYPISVAGYSVGHVTSGAPSPSLGENIGIAYVLVESARPGQSITIEIHRRPRQALTVPLPFHRSSVRRK